MKESAAGLPLLLVGAQRIKVFHVVHLLCHILCTAGTDEELAGNKAKV